jgi:hypothetical protein
VKASAVAQGRSAGDVKIFPGRPDRRATAAEAEEKYQAIRELADDRGRARLYRPLLRPSRFQRQYPLDAPFPELGEIGKQQLPLDHRPHQAQRRPEGDRPCARRRWKPRHPRTELIGSAEEIADRLIRASRRRPPTASCSASR